MSRSRRPRSSAGAGRYPLTELAQAQRDFHAKNFLGKLVIEP
jgi:hypothetical protein